MPKITKILIYFYEVTSGNCSKGCMTDSDSPKSQSAVEELEQRSEYYAHVSVVGDGLEVCADDHSWPTYESDAHIHSHEMKLISQISVNGWISWGSAFVPLIM